MLTLSACKKDVAPGGNLNGRSSGAGLPTATSGDGIVESQAPSLEPVHATVSLNCDGYYETLPARYDSSAAKYPLILFVHGIGELGNGGSDLSSVLRAGLPRLIYKKVFPPDFLVNGQHFSFIVISPQFKKRPGSAELESVLQYMLKKYRVDESRIYLTGLSMGGGVTWEFSAEHGNQLAAIVPLAGGTSPNGKLTEGIAGFNLPVWAFHNTDDNVVPVAFTLDFVAGINSFKPANLAKATIWTSGGHDCWTKGYDPNTREGGKNMYEWMLGFTNSRY